MKIIFICAVCLHLGLSYASGDSDGVGAFAYQDSSGSRYGGTYGLRNGQVVNPQGSFPPNFSPPPFSDFDDFFPEYFANLENILQEAFESNVENQKLAYNAAKKAYDLTSNQAGFNQNFNSRFPFGGDFSGFGGMPGGQSFPGYQGFQGFPNFPMPNFNEGNSAYAGGAIGPGFQHQVANVNPPNPANPNINKYSSIPNNPNGYKSVISSSSVSSKNINGQQSTSRRAETVIDNNGVVTRYKVEN